MTEDIPMWHTSHGDRALHGAEARLFAETMLSLLDEAQSDHLYDYDLVACFDNLTYGQKISVLTVIGNGLLREDVPAVPLVAVMEGGIAAVFQHLRNSVIFEIDEPDMGNPWRKMIVAARKEMEVEEVPEPACKDQEEWDFEIQELSDYVLWDADYECDDLFLDRPPDEARELRDAMRIPDDYFAAIADDLTERRIEAKLAELRAVCVAVIGILGPES